MRLIFHRRKAVLLPGQTIMEMLVVFLIISMGLYAAVTLIFSNLMHQENDEDNLVAVNLAREMLELAQNKRDSNWLVSADVNDGLHLGADCTAVPNWNGTGFPSFDFAPNSITDAGAIVNRSSLTASNGMFTNQAGTSTAYRRLMTFSMICANTADHSDIVVDASCACATAPYTDIVGMRARADVEWTRKGKKRSISVYTDQYDWR